MLAVNYLVKIIVRLAIIGMILVYALFSIILLSLGNVSQCERLETNYVTCEQYKNSHDLIFAETAVRLALPINLERAKIVYQLRGTKIAHNNLYLETSGTDILYITDIDGWAIEYPIGKIDSFIQGSGYGKTTLHLANSPSLFLSYLSICLILEILIISLAYYLDRLLLNHLQQSKQTS
ncbi:MAG: hypothetical protein AAFQ41_02195 [Cyanobacteria bacterium J06623_7]